MTKASSIKILAIETSCDETAAAVIDKTGADIKILSNVVASQIELHKKYGGVFPEHASRAHVEKIIPVVQEALQEVISDKLQVKRKFPYNVSTYNLLRDIDLIAVTVGPGLIGSLLIGVNFAKTLAFAKNLPIIGINHWLGHIYSNWAEEKNLELRTENLGKKPLSSKLSNLSFLPSFPALILIASGGHTGLVLMKSHKEIIPLGETLDDAAGEAFDKVAKLLDLGYPGGPAISKAAEKGNPNVYNFPRSMLERKDFDFSFSGLKTAVLYETKKNKKLSPKIKNDLAASFQRAVIEILIGKTIQAAYEYQPKSICLCGGVSANIELRKQMRRAVSGLPWHSTFHKPHLELSTDNAAMIGLAAAYHIDKATTYDKITANANLKL